MIDAGASRARSLVLLDIVMPVWNGADLVAIVDADLQDPPALIPALSARS